MDNINQTGGGNMIGTLLVGVTGVFFGVVSFIINLLVSIAKTVFFFRFDKENGWGGIIPRIHTKDGEGYIWKYIYICLKASMYLCIFALGGFWITIFGIGYLYSKLSGHLGTLGTGEFSSASGTPEEEPAAA
jgi:hypothetical protein